MPGQKREHFFIGGNPKSVQVVAIEAVLFSFELEFSQCTAAEEFVLGVISYDSG